jgi:beta-galactosidase
MAQKIRQFVEDGGTVVMTYWSGIVNESDLCFTGGWPGEGLRDVFGIWDEETDGLTESDRNGITFSDSSSMKLKGKYEARDICALIHAEGAEVLATYTDDFYAGRPAVTLNRFGKGKAYYIASRNEETFLQEFYRELSREIQIATVLDTELPKGVTVQTRTDGQREFIFIMNFTEDEQSINLGTGLFRDMESNENLTGPVSLTGYGVLIAERVTK